MGRGPMATTRTSRALKRCYGLPAMAKYKSAFSAKCVRFPCRKREKTSCTRLCIRSAIQLFYREAISHCLHDRIDTFESRIPAFRKYFLNPFAAET